MKRRDIVKPELKNAYKTLCSPQNEISTFLLGEDLPKLAKDSKESSNMTTHMVREQTKERGFHPYPYRLTEPGLHQIKDVDEAVVTTVIF